MLISSSLHFSTVPLLVASDGASKQLAVEWEELCIQNRMNVCPVCSAVQCPERDAFEGTALVQVVEEVGEPECRLGGHPVGNEYAGNVSPGG